MEKEELINIMNNYTRVQMIVNKLNDKIMHVAIESSCFQGHYFDAAYFCDKIIDLKLRKSALVALLAELDSLNASLPYNYRQAIKLKVFQQKTYQETADGLGLSLRTIFRLIDTALDRFFTMSQTKRQRLELIESVVQKEAWIKRAA